MWMARSSLLWAYALAVIVKLAVGKFLAKLFMVLPSFLLYIAVMYKATVRYTTRHSAISALRTRMLMCATIGNVLYGVAVTKWLSFHWNVCHSLGLFDWSHSGRAALELPRIFGKPNKGRPSTTSSERTARVSIASIRMRHYCNEHTHHGHSILVSLTRIYRDAAF